MKSINLSLASVLDVKFILPYLTFVGLGNSDWKDYKRS